MVRYQQGFVSRVIYIQYIYLSHSSILWLRAIDHYMYFLSWLDSTLLHVLIVCVCACARNSLRRQCMWMWAGYWGACEANGPCPTVLSASSVVRP